MPIENREGWELPDVIDPPESMRVMICIPKNVTHMKAFWGALYELTFWDNWQPDPEHKGTLVARVWYRYFLSWQRSMSELEECEGDMSQCCVPPAITVRIDPETGVIVQSTDGGNTWTPQPNGLPSVIVQPIPPVTSGVAATKCDAATNVAGQVDVWIDQVSNDFTTATTLLEFGQAVILAIVGAVLVVITGGGLAPLEALILAALGAALAAAWGAGKAVFDAYWTTDVKDAILCAAYCNIGEDGSYTDAQFSAFWNNVNSDLPPSPAKMLFMGFLSSVGKAGLNAMAASGMSADADCSDCSCTCTAALGFDTGGYATVLSVDEDTCTVVLQSVEDPTNPSRSVIGFNFGAGCAIVTINSNDNPSLGTVGWFVCGAGSESTGIYLNGQSVNYYYMQSNINTTWTMSVTMTAP